MSSMPSAPTSSRASRRRSTTSDIASMTASALAAENWTHAIQVVSGSAHWLTLKVACHLLTADRVVRFMTELQASAPDESRDLLIAAFRELLINAMEHGAGFDREKVVEVTAARTHRAIVFHFKDPGTGFDRADLAHAIASSQRNAVHRHDDAPRRGRAQARRIRHAHRQPRRRRDRLQRAPATKCCSSSTRTERPSSPASGPRTADRPTADPPTAEPAGRLGTGGSRIPLVRRHDLAAPRDRLRSWAK